MQINFPHWIIQNEIKNEKGELLEFVDHPFLIDPLRDFSPKQVYKKCAQIGVSVITNLKAFYMAYRFKLTPIYTMPSDTDVEEFSKTKTDPIFQNNEIIRKRLKVDNVGLKQVGKTFIYFKGTKSKTAPISTTADLLIHDELDRSDLKIVEFYAGRTTDSDYKGEWLISNPSFLKVGVDLAWHNSDQKEWFITCLDCKKEQVLIWEDNVDEIQGIFVCKYCHKEITDMERRLGKWKPTSKGEYSGYHFSQMMYVKLSAKELVNQKRTKGIEYFRNFVLGEPYSPGNEADFRQILTDSWTAKTLDKKPFFMGVDVGKDKHWVLGTKEGIFKIGKCESRQELESVINQYDPIIVMDSGPERTWAEEFRKKYPKLFICFYRRDRDQKEIVKWGGDKDTTEDAKNWGYVWIDRNRLIDALAYDLARGEILFNLPRDNFEEVIQHAETMRRVEVVDESKKSKRYVWETTTGVNHYFSAIWFYYIARQRGFKKVSVMEDEKKPEGLIVRTSDGHKMRDLKEVLDEIKNYQSE